MRTKHAVTGAFGYLGKYIAGILLEQGKQVITLTNSPDRPDPFGGQAMAVPYNFNAPNKLVKELGNVQTLYNTYWIRYTYGDFSFTDAIENTKTLIDAAAEARVRRLVHVSIANASLDSTLEYVRAKAVVEDHLKNSGIPYSIVRPTVLFGKEDVLINNLAWAVRRLPVIAYFGSGEYRIQPVYVEDLAEIVVREGSKEGNHLVDAAGAETFTYKELLAMIAASLGKQRIFMPVPAFAGFAAATVLGKLMKDVVMTKEELQGLMNELLFVEGSPAGTTKLSEWTKANADELGKRYKNDLMRRLNRKSSY